MSHILACLPANELKAGIDFLQKEFDGPKIIMREKTQFDDTLPEDVSQILLFKEEDMSSEDNVLKFLACRNFDYLCFSKTTNSDWQTKTGPGQLVAETNQFVLWEL